MSNQRNTYIIRTILVLAVIIAINIAAGIFNVFVDLTEDKRFTLSDSTINFIENVDDIIYVRVLLDGEFPAGFKRLRAATLDRLEQFAAVNPNMEYNFEDPMEGTVDEIKQRQERFRSMGMGPTTLTIADGDQRTQKLIYPFAVINYGSRQTVVNLLEPQGGMDQETALNNSINLLEFKIANAIQKLTRKDLPNIVISTGHGELPDFQTARLEQELKPYFDTGRLNLDSLVQLKPEDVQLLIMPAPQTTIPEKTQFVIDQYIMNGGKVLWLIENFKVNLDSINVNQLYVPKPVEHGLDDILFKYGVRVSKNLIMDLKCGEIPQVVGQSGGKAQTMNFPWYYHVVANSDSNQPIVKNINPVKFKFPSTIEVLEREDGIKKEVLMQSSEYSRFQIYPMRLTFEILRVDPDESTFNKGPQPIAVLLEGEFESFFKNRVSAESQDVLRQIGTSFTEKSPPTKQIVISDVDFMKNKYDPNTGQISAIGLSQLERNKVYEGNRSLILNSIEYLVDDFGLLEARSKDFKLRLLDKVKTKTESTKWQVINILMPLVLLWLFAFLFYFWRKRKYTSIQ